MVNSHLMCNPTIQQPDFDLSRQQWSLLNRFRTEQGHCGACRIWRLTDIDLCPRGEIHIVESCRLTKLNGGLSRIHSADEDALSWLINDQMLFMTRIREEFLINCYWLNKLILATLIMEMVENFGKSCCCRVTFVKCFHSFC